MTQTKAGAEKVRAVKIGVSIDEYRDKISSGFKWCYSCGQWLVLDRFVSDKSRHDGKATICRICKNAADRANYIPKPGPRRRGPLPQPPRDNDRQQARQRINVEVRTGRRQHPNQLPCADCGHIWKEGERRHEYDHHLGYSSEHHYDVEAVCTTCHRARAEAREEINQNRDSNGRYA